MRRYKILLTLLALWTSATRLMAQDVVVTVTPVQQVLPPQLLLYMTDPGKFFTISLTNTSGEDQEVYLGLQLQHVMPDDGLSISTPPQYQPTTPFSIPANGSYSLTSVDMKNLFNHIPANAMQIPDGLIDGYMNGSFGLLPEGNYQVQFQAYKWKSPKYPTPVACSNPLGGKASFTVCYNASAPTFLTPVIGVGQGDFTVADVSIQNPQFTWTQPVLTCNPKAFTYTYSIRFVELLKNQQPDVAMDQNPVVYQRDGLMAAMFIMDNNIVKTKFSTDKTYVAQVTATAQGGSALNYISITNEGKSPIRLFRLVEGKIDDGKKDDGGDKKDDEEDDKKDDKKDRHFKITEGDISEEDLAGALYNFRNPDITSPDFHDGEVRKHYKEADLSVSWDPAWYIGGEGENPYDLKVDYTVELFNGGDEADTKKTLEGKPIYTKKVGEETTLDIPWTELEDKINLKDYLVLRVKANCEGQESVKFHNDSINVMDFTLSEHINPKYFECSATVILENFNITTKKASDFEGKEVGLGEYQLTIDKIESGDAEKGFTGRGRVKWELPIGAAMIHVKFDTLRINTDDVVIGGLATSYAEPKMTNYEAVENIFSDLGLEDMLAKTGVPYADKVTTGAKKTIADKIDGLANYYSLVKSAGGIVDILSGGTANVYMPICLPKDKVSQLNSSPVDIQITTMKFAPTWATMDLIGIFTMPDSKCLASDLLVFGCPRLCVSPNSLIPEAGTLALLDKFTVKDPNTNYECTFNAPKDLLKPSDGCFVSWKNYKFEAMGVDVDMKIPGLKKYDEKLDTITNELPNLKLQGFIASWDDFKIDEVTMDPFEADDLPGFTFKASKIGYDHSLYSNCAAMAGFKFPEGYNKQEGVGEANYKEHGLDGWEGLYIGEISIAMPKGITGTDGRLKISGKNMLFDQSGVTLDADLEELIGASVGGFSFEINRVGLTFIQNDFDNCHIDGSITLPILKTEKKEDAVIGLNCQIRKQIDDKGKKGDEFVYVFNTKSLNGNYMLDLFLAKLVLDEKLTYFLVEAEPEKNKQGESELKTKCELLMGGRIEIGGKEVIEDWLHKDLGFKLSLPDIHFVGMRLANCKSWKSKYVDIQADLEKERAAQKKDALGGLYYAGKEIHNGKKNDGSDATFFFHTGSWSLASYKKQLGPFEFSLEDYTINKKMSGKDLDLGLDVTGKVALIKGIDISASVTLSITGKITGIGTDLSKIGCEFGGVELNKMAVDASFCGIVLKGSVEFDTTGKNTDVGKGFAASLDITLPGDLFTVHGDGGYFDYDGEDGQYSWGWVHLSIGGKIELGPCAITKLGGGFYFNCSRNSKGDDQKPNRVAGLVGIFMELGMASPDGETIKGELTLNVVYNRKRKCLSNFTMTGNVKAVGGIINANMTLVYENTETDRYLQINITADASLSAESMAGALDSFGANLGTIKEQMQKLAGNKFKDLITDCKQGLSSKIGAKATDADADKKPEEITTKEETPSDVASKSKTSKQGGLPKMGATISLDVKITWRAGGTNYKKPKWHVYLGEPAEDKRCTLTLIDFESGIVDCHVGANAYICVGNELPNNGELPPLPDKIAKFLDGSKHGDYQSDNAAQAQQARQAGLQGFNGEISGGVMLGAMAYGDITINLGLIEGKLEAILGFDVSVVHYKNGYCVNLGKVPGYKGWYGKGQLYAYLYLMLALHFNLGFVDYDFKIAEAEIGGVLKMGGPSPNYFQGKARAKISLLGGLFKFDKSFEFDCGQYCQLFKGNPLDDFILFDDCSLGDTIRTKGWTQDKSGKTSVTADMQPKVKVNVRTPQYANTKAPIGEHFRLLDENELERIAGQFGEGSKEWEDSKMQAKRTFVFRDFGEVWLFEYSSPSNYRNHSSVSESATFQKKKDRAMEYCGADKMYTIPLENGGSKSRRYLDMAKLRYYLKAGKFYRLVAAGFAKEIQKGVEVDPYTYYNQGKNVGYIAWIKSTEYFFQTEKEDIVDDKAPLQDYVAIAYPSNYNQLRSPESDIDKATGAVKHIKAYLGDVQAPTIALTEDIRTKAFKNGKLYWRLLNPMGKQIDIVENAWVEGKDPNGTADAKTLNMEPKRKLNAKAGEKYILQLDYYSREYKAEDEFNPDSKKWQTVDTTLVKLYVETLASEKNWRTGTGTGIRSCEYDQPFIAQKVTSTTIDRPYKGSRYDIQILDGYYYTQCPFTFISYMSNYVFPAGWEITDRRFYGIEVTTSESMLFQDPNGGGKYEGVYNQLAFTRSHDAFDAIKNTVIYTVPGTTWKDAWGETHYARPIQFPLSKYWHENGYGSWDYVHDVDDRILPYYPTTTINTDYYAKAIFDAIKKVYSRVNSMNVAIHNVAVQVENYQRYWAPGNNSEQARHNAINAKKDKLKEWYANHRGTYVNESGQYVHAVDENHSFFVPAYQFPVIWGISAAEKISGAYKGMSSDNDRALYPGQTWSRLSGMTWYKGYSGKWWHWEGSLWTNKSQWTYEEKPAQKWESFKIAEAKALFKTAYVTAYRVNAFDMNSGHYYAVNNLLNGRSWFKIMCNDPLTDNHYGGVISETFGNTTGTSVGTATGTSTSAQNAEKTIDKTTYSTISSSTMEKYMRQVSEIHDSCEVLFNTMKKYWPRYEKWAQKLPKPADNAEYNAKRAVSQYSYGPNASQTVITRYKNNVTTYNTEAKKWRDSVYLALRCVNPDGQWSMTSPVTNKYGKFRAMTNMVKSINYYMDRFITPQSDTNTDQYKRFKSMQDDAKSWNSQTTEWYDSIYASCYKSQQTSSGVMKGFCKQYIDKITWSENHLKKMTQSNYDKGQKAYQTIIDYKNEVITGNNCIQKRAQAEVKAANSTLSDARANNTAISWVNSLTRANTFVARHKEVLKSHQKADDVLKSLGEYNKTINRYMKYMGGDDGEHGQYAVFKDIFNEDCRNCYYTRQWYDNLKSVRDKNSADSTSIVNQLAKLPTYEESEKLIEQGKRLVDKYSGRNLDAANKQLQRLDSLLGALQQQESKYDSKANRRAHFDNMQNLYRNANDAYTTFKKGDLSKIDACIEACDKYDEELAAYEKYHSDMVALVQAIPSKPTSIWEGFKKAGFPSSHEIVVNAKKKWNDENGLTNISNYTDEVKKLYDQAVKVFSPSMNNYRNQAERYKEDNSSLLTNVGPFVVNVMKSMYNAAKTTTDGKKLGNTQTYYDKAYAYYSRMGNYKKYADSNWSYYEALLSNMNTSNDKYEKYLKDCISNCTMAYEQIDAAKGYYNESSPFLSQAIDSLKKAEKYMAMIPVDNANVANAKSSYQSAKVNYDRIVAHYKPATQDLDSIAKLYRTTLPNRYEKDIAPTKQKAEEALAYLEKNNKPERPKTILIPYYLKELKAIRNEASSTLNQIKSSNAAFNKKLSTFKTNYNSMKSSYTTCNKYTYNATNKTSYKKNIDMLGTYVTNLTENYNDLYKTYKEALTLYNDIQKKKTEATTANNYIRANAPSNSVDYSTSTNYYNSFSSDISSCYRSVKDMYDQLMAAKTQRDDGANYKKQAYVNYYYRQMTFVSKDMPNTLKSVKSLSESSTGTKKTLDTNYSSMNTAWNNYSSTPKLKPNKTRLTNYLNNCETYATAVINGSSTLGKYSSNGRVYYNQAQTDLENVNTGANYIKSNADPSSAAYKSYASVVANIQSTVKSINTYITTIQSNYTNGETKKSSAMTMKDNVQKGRKTVTNIKY
ncbi:MAG: hypothetical protein K5945_10035 [Bacteroidaceae bacterium]|nr:hypothetical protein [Bacteroidaceae bacterium]